MARVLLNIDAGELPDETEDLWALADLLNVACGGHAGDDASMARVARAAARTGARLGAHPSFEDRDGFGRVRLAVAPDLLEEQVERQCARLRRVAEAAGARVTHAKLHGALYHAADADADVARACVAGIARALGRPALVGPDGGALAEEAARRGLALLREAFADRGVRADGSLIPRGEPGALVREPARAAARARALAADARVDTVCVHGDTDGALEIARAVRDALDAASRGDA
ncbi:MAG: LamB/YcsF family protein [Polyangiaceae bacterium]